MLSIMDIMALHQALASRVPQATHSGGEIALEHAGTPGMMHPNPSVHLEMQRQAIKDHLKRVRMQELEHEMHHTVNARMQDIHKEQAGLFDKKQK